MRSGARVMCHVQQAKLTALHLKPRILRRDMRVTVGIDFPRKPWLDIEYMTEEVECLQCMDGGKT